MSSVHTLHRTGVSRPTAAADRWASLAVCLAALLLFFLRFGHDYGSSDQDELIPVLLHEADPALFANDWFVQTQSEGFSVRRYFLWVLVGLHATMPLWLAFLTLYLASWLGTAAAVYVMARHLTGNVVAAAAAVVGALVLTPQWTLGGNDLVHNLLVPSMPAWTCALWGLYAVLRERHLLAGALLGVATCLQALVGLQVAGLLGLCLAAEQLWHIRTGNRATIDIRPLLQFTSAYLLLAAFVLVPVLGQVSAPAGGQEPSIFYIMAQFRNPHHYLPFSFSARSALLFSCVTLVGLAAGVWLYRRGGLRHGPLLASMLGAVVAIDVGALFFTEFAPLLFVAKLQLFKYTVLVKLLMVIVICGAAVRLLPDALQAWLDGLFSRGRTLAAVAFVGGGVVLAAALLGDGLLHDRIRFLARAETPAARVAAWARTQTPPGAVFATPPSLFTFRTDARRAIVVNFKAFPFQEAHIGPWFTRLTDLAPAERPARGGGAVLPALDAAYHRLSPAQVVDLAGRYGFDFIVRARPFEGSPAPLTLAHSTGGWHVYHVSPAAD